jgi:hypothetical protein|tara:strand:+ start:191 stop:742 length:552 start_codon:yes stop_codon:yes gene_type:complete
MMDTNKNPDSEQKYIYFSQDLFVLKSYFTSLKSHIDNDKLAKEIMANPVKIENSPYHTNYEDFDLQASEGSEALKLLTLINEDIAAPMNLQIDGYWAHVHLPLESTQRHNHNGSNRSDAVSWVYYVKVPERAGDLVFHLHDLVDPAIVKPKEGLLVLFPSYLDHAVTKNLSTGVRISISGNLL